MATAVLLLAFHWTLEGPRTIQSLLLLIPKSHRENSRELITSMETKVSFYIAGQGVLCLIIGIMSLVAYLLIGWPRRGFVVRLAWISLYLVTLGSFGLLLLLAGGSAISELRHFAHSVSAQDAWKLPVWLEASLFQQVLVARLPPRSKLFEAVTGSQGQLVLPALFGVTQGIAGPDEHEAVAGGGQVAQLTGHRHDLILRTTRACF